jgi:hypothetical protein
MLPILHIFVAHQILVPVCQNLVFSLYVLPKMLKDQENGQSLVGISIYIYLYFVKQLIQGSA